MERTLHLELDVSPLPLTTYWPSHFISLVLWQENPVYCNLEHKSVEGGIAGLFTSLGTEKHQLAHKALCVYGAKPFLTASHLPQAENPQQDFLTFICVVALFSSLVKAMDPF